MDKLNFNKEEVVKIDNKKQFDEIYKFLRSSDSMSLDDWLNLVGGYPKFPIYLEWAESAFTGSSIGFTTEPKNTWTKEPYKIVLFNKLKKKINENRMEHSKKEKDH